VAGTAPLNGWDGPPEWRWDCPPFLVWSYVLLLNEVCSSTVHPLSLSRCSRRFRLQV
jgi:hypothetical protein